LFNSLFSDLVLYTYIQSKPSEFFAHSSWSVDFK